MPIDADQRIRQANLLAQLARATPECLIEGLFDTIDLKRTLLEFESAPGNNPSGDLRQQGAGVADVPRGFAAPDLREDRLQQPLEDCWANRPRRRQASGGGTGIMGARGCRHH